VLGSVATNDGSIVGWIGPNGGVAVGIGVGVGTGVDVGPLGVGLETTRGVLVAGSEPEEVGLASGAPFWVEAGPG
jgi:hypothetical protein